MIDRQIGIFWTPLHSKQKFAGVVKFDDNRILLQIYGGPLPGTEYMKYELNFHKAFPVVYGECLDYNKVTFVNLKLENFKSTNGRSQYDYIVDYFVFGAKYLTDTNKPLITYSMLSFYRMNEFLKESVIEWDDFFKNGVNAKIQIKSKPERVLFKNKFREDYILHRLGVTQASNPVDNFIRSQFFYNTKFKKKISFFQFAENWRNFQTFFSIATCKHTNIKTAYFKCGEVEYEVINSDILYNRERGDEITKNLMVKFEDIEIMKFKPFEKWMFAFDAIEHSVFLFQNSLKELQTMTAKNYFLNMFFCNESIMKVITGYLQPSEKIPGNIERIADKYGIKGNDRESLMSKFKKQHATCITYFEELQNKIPSVVKQLFGDDYIDVIKTAKNTRDLYVHKNIETTKTVIKVEEDLLRVSSKLRVLFQANCLLFMGFDEAQVGKMLFRSPSNTILV